MSFFGKFKPTDPVLVVSGPDPIVIFTPGPSKLDEWLLAGGGIHFDKYEHAPQCLIFTVHSIRSSCGNYVSGSSQRAGALDAFEAAIAAIEQTIGTAWRNA